MDRDEAKEKYLSIAYKRLLIDKDACLISILRQRYITFGKTDFYFFNTITSYNQWSQYSDYNAETYLLDLFYAERTQNRQLHGMRGIVYAI